MVEPLLRGSRERSGAEGGGRGERGLGFSKMEVFGGIQLQGRCMGLKLRRQGRREFVCCWRIQPLPRGLWRGKMRKVIKSALQLFLLRLYFWCLKAANPPPVGLGAFPVVHGEGLSGPGVGISGYRGRVFLGVFALFRMTDAPGQPREELPRPAGARARLRSVRPRGGQPCPGLHDAAAPETNGVTGRKVRSL